MSGRLPTFEKTMTTAAFMLAGFLAMVIGLALWSVPLALIVGGVLLFVAGGLEHRRSFRP